MHRRIKSGSVTIPGGVHPWPHETRVARILADAGHCVEFILEANITKSADFMIDGIAYELKSPKGARMTSVERNLKRASKQSKNIVFDSSRMSNVRDDSIVRYLKRKLQEQKTIKIIIFISKNDNIIVL